MPPFPDVLPMDLRPLLAVPLLMGILVPSLSAEEFVMKVRQLTRGPEHHFFGYIGQSLTTPWNFSGQYILALRAGFHDRMPDPADPADIVLIDTLDGDRVIPLEQTRAWNFQQGTMLYWHPRHSETRFFFNDRDPETNHVYTVLYDVQARRRVREFRHPQLPIANGGVSPNGEFFLAINYGRLARLRPVTGYPDAADPTASIDAPDNDGVFRVEIETGEWRLLASFQQIRHRLSDDAIDIRNAAFYINHTLISRSSDHVYFFARARRDGDAMAINIPCSMRTDGTDFQVHEHIGGHPEWDDGTVVIGARDNRQILYDIKRHAVVGQIGTPESIPQPGGDISLAPNPDWIACGYSTSGGLQNRYVVIRRSDGAFVRSPSFSRGPYTSGELRIDPAPRWNRDATALLVPGMTPDGSRQLHLIAIEQR